MLWANGYVQEYLLYMKSIRSHVSNFHSYSRQLCPQAMDVLFINRESSMCRCGWPWAALALFYEV